MAFATTEDLRVELGLSSLTQDQTARAQRRLDAATAAIKRFTHQEIEYVASDAVTLVGNWSSRLVLPQVPVASVTSVVVEGETLTSGTDYSLEGRTLHRGFVPWTYEARPWRVPPASESHWGGPEVSIVVTYSHGFDPVPADIAEICVNAALRGWDTPTGAVSEKIGAWSAQYGPAAAAGAVALTREEKAHLRDLRRLWQAAT